MNRYLVFYTSVYMSGCTRRKRKGQMTIDADSHEHARSRTLEYLTDRGHTKINFKGSKLWAGSPNQ